MIVYMRMLATICSPTSSIIPTRFHRVEQQFRGYFNVEGRTADY